ncbi:MAG: DMT family transporter [Chloroflexota bacterium]
MSQGRLRFILPLGLLTAILAVSTASIFIRFAQREAPSLVIAALRLTFASLALTPVALTRGRAELRRLSRRDLLLGLLAGVFLAVHFATWISSLEYTSIASSVVLVSTGPLWVALLSPLFLREPLTRPALFGMILALAGGTVIGLGDSCTLEAGLPAPPAPVTQAQASAAWGACPPLSEFVQGKAFLGNFLALAGAWAVAGYLMIGRSLRAGMSLVPYIFLVYSVAALALLGIMFAAGQRPTGFSPLTYVWIALLALIPQLIGHSTYNWALRYLPAALVSITTLGEPVGSAILAYFILQEAPSALTLLGGALILAGIYLASSKGRA